MRKAVTSNNEDLKLIKLIKNRQCNSSFGRLQEKHSNLFYSICNKFGNQIDLDEVYKDKDFVMFKAINSFECPDLSTVRNTEAIFFSLTGTKLESFLE